MIDPVDSDRVGNTAPRRPWIGFPRTFAKLVAGTNIHPDTLLATDYLNHFNEAIMLVELVPSMPECLDDLRDWQPVSYEQHFAESNLSDGPLAILAYENSRPCFRKPFDETVNRIRAKVGATIEDLDRLIAAGADEAQLTDIANDNVTHLRNLLDIASAIIHGSEATADQATIDRLLD